MINPSIRSVYEVDVRNLVDKRDNKYCVCVSIGSGKYLLINSKSRQIYNDFEIKAIDYQFLAGENRFISCSKLFVFDKTRLLRKVGTLSDSDTKKVIAKIYSTDKIPEPEKVDVIRELLQTVKS